MSPPHTARDTSSKPLSEKLLLVSEGCSQDLSFQTQKHFSPLVYWGWLLSISLPDSKAMPAPESYWWDGGTKEMGNEPCVQGGDRCPLQGSNRAPNNFSGSQTSSRAACHRGRNSLAELQFLLSQTPLHSRASGLISVPVLLFSSAPLISRSPTHRCLLLPSEATACAVVTASWKAQAKPLKSPLLKINRCCFQFLKTTWD